MLKKVSIIGTGMGSLTAGAILAKNGWQVHFLEQNWIPGGCTTSYPRKNYVFEAGATTIVGMDDSMPLKFLLDYCQIEIPMRKLEIPMQVWISNNSLIKYQEIEKWIDVAKTAFEGDQEGFWKEAYRISQFVWQSSIKFLDFPPRNLKDLWSLALKSSISDVWNARFALQTTSEVMRKFKVDTPTFRQYVNEQLMITAQNKCEEVNFLFGAAALCYTNYQNFYVDGGLRNLVQPILDYTLSKGGSINFREPVVSIKSKNSHFEIITKNSSYVANNIIAGIPINNLVELMDSTSVVKNSSIMKSCELNSAFQLGIAFKPHRKFDSLHHQIHLEKPLAHLQANSIFVSLSHPDDTTRSDDQETCIASVSTHWPNPGNIQIETDMLEKEILDTLEQNGFLKKENIIFSHSSGPKSWQKWTGRKWGFVGGYPQFQKIKPWQMNETRILGKGIYLTGDSVYPGQGIPGVTLSGIIAARKLMKDAGKKVDF